MINPDFGLIYLVKLPQLKKTVIYFFTETIKMKNTEILFI